MDTTRHEKARAAALVRHAAAHTERALYWAHLDSKLEEFRVLRPDATIRTFCSTQRTQAVRARSHFRSSTLCAWLREWRKSRERAISKELQ